MPVTVTLLDHHGDPLAEPRTATVGEGEPTVVAFTLPSAVLTSPHGVEGMHLRTCAPIHPSAGTT